MRLAVLPLCALVLACADTQANAGDRSAATDGDASPDTARPATGGRPAEAGPPAAGGSSGAQSTDASLASDAAEYVDASLDAAEAGRVLLARDVETDPMWAPRMSDATPDVGAFFGPPRDAGETPPPYCVAPCVWEAFRRCQAEMQTCIEAQTSVPATTTCDLASGWSVTDGYYNFGSVVYSIRRYGELCFGASGFVMRPTTDTIISYRSYEGAVGLSVSPRTVHCGDISDPTLVWGQDELPPGVEVYEMRPNAPECAPYARLGPKVELGCETTYAGYCPDQ